MDERWERRRKMNGVGGEREDCPMPLQDGGLDPPMSGVPHSVDKCVVQ